MVLNKIYISFDFNFIEICYKNVCKKKSKQKSIFVGIPLYLTLASSPVPILIYLPYAMNYGLTYSKRTI